MTRTNYTKNIEYSWGFERNWYPTVESSWLLSTFAWAKGLSWLPLITLWRDSHLKTIHLHLLTKVLEPFFVFFLPFLFVFLRNIFVSFWTANKIKEFWFSAQLLLKALHCSMYQCLILDLWVVCVAAQKSNYPHVSHLYLIIPLLSSSI